MTTTVKLKIPRAGMQPRKVVDEDGNTVERLYPFAEQEGDYVEMPDDVAQRYIDRGYAEAVATPIMTATATGERTETRADANSTDEVSEPPRRRRGRPRKSESGQVAPEPAA